MSISTKMIRYDKQALAEYDFGPVRDRVIAERGLTAASYAKHEGEMRRFFHLVGTTDGPTACLNKTVDEIWHQLVLFTPLYRDFCSSVFGEFVDHVPRTEHTPISVSAINNFVNDYKREFGSLDPVWLEDVPVDWKHAIEAAQAPEHIDFKWSGWPGRGALK